MPREILGAEPTVQKTIAEYTPNVNSRASGYKLDRGASLKTVGKVFGAVLIGSVSSHSIGHAQELPKDEVARGIQGCTNYLMTQPETKEMADQIIDRDDLVLPDMDKERSRAILELALGAKIASTLCAKAFGEREPEFKVTPNK